MEVAETCQSRLFSAYRLDQYSDPEGYMAQVAAIFSQYNDAVLMRATDPFRRDCIQRTYKFPPSLQEITEALDNTEKTVRALAHVEERTSRGFSYVDGRGFINAAGEKYDPAKHRSLPQITFPVAPAD
jgi:hypothetical protein